MCIIIIKPKGQEKIPLEHLYNSSENNPDMVAFYASNGIENVVKKYQNTWDMIEGILSYNNKDYLVVVHARISTSGAVDFTNCHPFPLSIDYKDVLDWKKWDGKRYCHNGILSKYEEQKSKFNDTIHFGVKFLSKTENKNRIEKEIGVGNKIVVMDKDNFIIYNEKAGHWNNNIWYSNNMYMPYTYKSSNINGLGFIEGGFEDEIWSDDYIKIYEYLSENYGISIIGFDINDVVADIKTSSGLKLSKDCNIYPIVESYYYEYE